MKEVLCSTPSPVRDREKERERERKEEKRERERDRRERERGDRRVARRNTETILPPCLHYVRSQHEDNFVHSPQELS
jgi:hypothetical protein